MNSTAFIAVCNLTRQLKRGFLLSWEGAGLLGSTTRAATKDRANPRGLVSAPFQRRAKWCGVVWWVLQLENTRIYRICHQRSAQTTLVAAHGVIIL